MLFRACLLRNVDVIVENEKHLVWSSLLLSTRDPTAPASRGEHRGWGRKKTRNNHWSWSKPWDPSSAVLPWELLISASWVKCILSTLLVSQMISIIPQQGLQLKCVVQPGWTMSVFHSVISGYSLGNTCPTFWLDWTAF